METVTITIDGREVSGHPGMTVLELARESGLEIPTLCYDPHLNPIGACRICLVEEEQSGALMASCVTPISPGMAINTSSERVIEHRKTIINLMLSSHPDSCMMCDKGNRCQLRQIAADMGIGLIEMQRIPKMVAIQEVNPFVERDLSKCILCGKCIRACQELVVEGAIDYFQRGFVAKPATFGDMPLEASECTFCGTCVAMCPTGALMEKEKDYHGTTDTATETTCPYCGCGCTIRLEVKDGQIVRSSPGDGTGINNGTLCVKGSQGYDFVHSPDRISRPLVRMDEGLQEVSWETALDRAAKELGQIVSQHGPTSVAVLGSPVCTNEDNYTLQWFARCVLGTNNIDSSSRLHNTAYENHPLTRQKSLPLDELEQSEVIVVIGADLSSSAPILEYAIKRAVRFRGAKLILIDPRQTKLAPFAQFWLSPIVGSDTSLLQNMAKFITNENLIDKEFIEHRTRGFDKYVRDLPGYVPDETEITTGIPAESVQYVARIFAGADKASVVYGAGITRYTSKIGVIDALSNLMLLTGNVTDGKPRLYPVSQENNGRGAIEMGVTPDLLPGYQSILDNEVRKRFEKYWGGKLPGSRGLNLAEIIQHLEKGNIRGLYVMGDNPLMTMPNPFAINEALDGIECLIVQDIFLNDTAKKASVFLPAASFAEREGHFTSFDGNIRPIQRVIAPSGKSLPDWQIIGQLAERMGYRIPFSSPEQISDEIGRMLPDQSTQDITKTKLPFYAATYDEPRQYKSRDFPFLLLTGNARHHQGTGTRSTKSKRLARFAPQAFLEICRSDANRLVITDSDMVKVISPVGEIIAPAKITDTLTEGLLFIPTSFPETPVNRLYEMDMDTKSSTPAVKPCRVKLEKVGINE